MKTNDLFETLAREITKEETLDILKAADDEGLVHIIDNMEGHMSTICNCCGGGCAFLRPINETGDWTCCPIPTTSPVWMKKPVLPAGCVKSAAQWEP